MELLRKKSNEGLVPKEGFDTMDSTEMKEEERGM